ncbi:hypothetical protein CERSUDRAFT_78578 [Gelatoporia subvermispora B]|uniref:Uncharacterized protein n=1 Tax=Ceriporiopsis subvermispora (strain B) TaxID=914234 RepID=M2QY33_CERS8|nr:hypothetical protein CERSUDRAFT_78578 [Gelatoporia subvermispora B]
METCAEANDSHRSSYLGWAESQGAVSWDAFSTVPNTLHIEKSITYGEHVTEPETFQNNVEAVSRVDEPSHMHDRTFHGDQQPGCEPPNYSTNLRRPPKEWSADAHANTITEQPVKVSFRNKMCLCSPETPMSNVSNEGNEHPVVTYRDQSVQTLPSGLLMFVSPSSNAHHMSVIPSQPAHNVFNASGNITYMDDLQDNMTGQITESNGVLTRPLVAALNDASQVHPQTVVPSTGDTIQPAQTSWHVTDYHTMSSLSAPVCWDEWRGNMYTNRNGTELSATYDSSRSCPPILQDKHDLMSCTIEQQAGTLSAAVERDDQDTESDKCSATMFDSQYEHELVEAVGNHATMRMSHSSYRSELTYALDEGPRFSSSGKTTAVADIAGRSVEEVDVSIVTESPDLCHIEQGAHGVLLASHNARGPQPSEDHWLPHESAGSFTMEFDEYHASTSLEYTPPAPSTSSIFGGNQMYTFVRMESPTPIPVSQDSMGGRTKNVSFNVSMDCTLPSCVVEYLLLDPGNDLREVVCTPITNVWEAVAGTATTTLSQTSIAPKLSSQGNYTSAPANDEYSNSIKFADQHGGS